MRLFALNPSCVLGWMATFGVLCSMVGCSKAQEALSEQERAHAVRNAVNEYANAVSSTMPEQKTWTDSYKESTERKDFAGLRETLLDAVLPALNQTIQSLESVPTETDSLRGIHGSLVAAYRRLAQDLNAFATGLNAENYNEHRKSLASRLTHFHHDQRVYREQIQAYYESVGVTLIAPP
jgi:hypothetical protein